VAVAAVVDSRRSQNLTRLRRVKIVKKGAKFFCENEEAFKPKNESESYPGINCQKL
jgi:hypothetical protein